MNGTNESQRTRKHARSATVRIGIGKEKIKRHKHGQSRTRLYRTWAGMKSRCSNKNQPNYKYYGGKGVCVCKEWSSRFLVFKEWALKNGYREDLTIDRIDVNGNYEPENCRFITKSKNLRNARKVRTIRQAAIMVMKDSPNFWVEPEKVNIKRKVFEELYEDGICNRRVNPYNSSVYQYKLFY